ncbi:MAG: DNA translocase FtsK 4TM domain-containing protein [Phycisphaerae bacterium]
MGSGAREDNPRRLLVPLVGLALCAFVWPALVTLDFGDWPSPHQYPPNDPPANACGIVGAWLAYHLYHALGHGAYPLLAFATLGAVVRLVRGRLAHRVECVLGVWLCVVCTGAAAHLALTPAADALPAGYGGVIGFAVGEYLRSNLSGLGTGIVLVATATVGLLFATQGWVLKAPAVARRLGSVSRGAVSAARHIAAATPVPRLVPAVWPDDNDRDAVVAIPSHQGRRKTLRRRAGAPGAGGDVPDATGGGVSDPDVTDADAEDEVATGDVDYADEHGAREASGHRRRRRGAAADKPARRSPESPARSVIVNVPRPIKTTPTQAYPAKIENWALPPLSLLAQPSYSFTAQQELVVREQAKVLERTLEEFRLDAHVVEIDTGPVITMFELRIGAGIKVSQIASLSNDIARALRAHAVRVVAPISGKNTVGIEVPNAAKEQVRLKELMNVAGKNAAAMALPLFLGKDAGGAALVADLAKMPHLLIAGTTGSGKSVCMNAIIVSLLMTQRPDHVKLILIDPKMVEMSQFKGVPHLMSPIVTDMVKAERILEWAVTKMNERYELLAEARVKNIAAYNALGADEIYERFDPSSDQERAAIPTRMPYIVILIDELADLMMTSGKEVEHHLARLAQKSRAVGVHIIVATQRPEAKVVTGLIKSNMPCRIAFRVASRMDSRIVLDQNGGEVLMGQGDMLFLPPGSHKLLRAQGTYLDDAEVRAVLDNLAEAAEPEFHPELLQVTTACAADDDERDPLFDTAVRIVLESKRGSVSLLQRRLTVGYSRASRLIEQMAAAGIVGDHKGSQAREVSMTLQDWDALQHDADNHTAHEAEPDVFDG